MSYRLFIIIAASASLLPASACVAPLADEAEDVAGAEQPEVWSDADDPTTFTSDLERRLSALPDTGAVSTVPWAGSYWPTWQDSINYKWDGARSESPSKKFERAFELSNIEEKVSKFHGVDSHSGAKTCWGRNDCNASAGENCAKRSGESKGHCIPTWFGLCHAWAAASILLPEPRHDVVKNGVTFKVQDIKALITLVHNTTTSRYVSLRCEEDAESGGLTLDDDGRPTSECRDTNAGTFHILLANYIGVLRRSFLEDRTFDDQVWNQPIRWYKVVADESITAEDANRRLSVTPVGGSKRSGSGSLRAREWSNVVEVPVSPGQVYVVRMTGTADADLYVRMGSPPTESQYACRPYQSDSDEECRGTVPAGVRRMFVAVRSGEKRSTYSFKAAAGHVPSEYVRNPDAASLAFVKTDVAYVVSSEATTDGNLASQIDQYTRVERYQYVLELDSHGAIIGGEWVGETRRRHPDFLWLPSAASGPGAAGGAISYARVKELADASVE